MEHRIVLCKSYGGFVLSDKAYEWLRDNEGLELCEYSHSWCHSKYHLKSLLDESIKWRYDLRLIHCLEVLGQEAVIKGCRFEIVTIEGDLFRIESVGGWEEILTPKTIIWEKIN